MTKTDFSLKKDVLNLQKKVADLELVATELKEALTKFDTAALEELKQRIEDVEDLTMVENAAVVELKKLLEESKPQAQITPELEEKIKSLEEKISSITVPNVEEIKNSVISSIPQPTIDTTKFEQTISELKTYLENLKNEIYQKFGYIEERFSNMEHTLTSLPDVNTLKTDLKHEILSSLPDYDLVRADLQSVIETFKSEFEKEKERVKSLLDFIKEQLSKPLPEKVVEELEKIRSDYLVNNAKVEAVEKFVESFSNELNNLKPIIAKLETFDKLMNLHEELSNKLQSYKELQSRIEKDVEKNMDTEKKIQHEANKLRDAVKDISKFKEELKRLEKETEKSKRSLQSFTENINFLKDLNRAVNSLEEKINLLEKDAKDFHTVISNLDKKLKSTEEKITNLQDDMSIFQGNLMALEQNRQDLTASIADLQETIKNQAKIDLSGITKKIYLLETELENIKSLISYDKTNELIEKLKELENKIDSLSTSMIFNEQMNEVVDRLVFLESRLAAIETMVQDIPRYSPIVVE